MHDKKLYKTKTNAKIKFGVIDTNNMHKCIEKFLKKDDELFKQQVASSLLVCITDIFKEKVNKNQIYYYFQFN